MKGDIPAIPTLYRGNKYRSRSEARWALFFDFMGIPYEYEPEKVFTGHCAYIPDFLLSFSGTCYSEVLFEVKGREATMAEMSKLANAAGTDRLGLIASGPLTQYVLTEVAINPDGLFTSQNRFNQCLHCGALATQVLSSSSWGYDSMEHHFCDQRTNTLRCLNVNPNFWYSVPEPPPSDPPVSPIVTLALEWAQNARFENPNFYEQIQGQQETFDFLKKSCVFGSTRAAWNLTRFASFTAEAYPHLLFENPLNRYRLIREDQDKEKGSTGQLSEAVPDKRNT